MGTSNLGSPTPADGRTVYVSIEGEGAVLTAECEAGDTLGAMLAALNHAHGRQDLLDFAVSVENEEAETAATLAVRDVFGTERRGRIHLHRCRSVKVGVEYNGRSVGHQFPPSATIHRVMAWAVGPSGFKVEEDAHDLTLQARGTSVPLAPNIHIGTLVLKGQCDLQLELVPKDRPQG